MLVALFVITFFLTSFGRLFDVESGFATGLSIKNLLFGLSITVIALSIATRRIQASFPLTVFGPLFIGCVMAGLSILIISVFSIYSGYSSIHALINLKNKLVDPLLMLTIGYFSVQTPKSALTLFKIFTLMIVCGCLITIVDVFNIPDLGLISARDEDGRIEGFIGSSEEFSTIVAATLPILMVGIKRNGGYAKLIAYFSLLIMVICLMLAGTRAPIIGLIGAWLVYVIFVERDSFISLLRAFALALTVIVVVSFFLYSTPYWEIIAERFTTGFSSGNITELSSGRSVIWEKIFSQMYNQPSSFIIGMGWDVYFQSIGHRYATHNIFIDRFYSLGLLGLLVYLFAYVSALKLLFKPSSVNSDFGNSIRISAGLSLIVLLIDAMFADLEISEFYIYAFVGMGLRVTFLKEIQYNNAPKPSVAPDSRNSYLNRF